MPNFLTISAVICLLLAPSLLPAATPAPAPPKEQEAVKITLHPMTGSRPALKYQLLPPFLERRPGNAAVRWNRLSVEQAGFLTEVKKPAGTWEKTQKWMEIPIGDPKQREFRSKEPAVNELLRNGLFADMDYAARFESCDWELPLREGHIVEMLIPEAQMNRFWANMLAAKAHGEIADKKYPEAVRTFQTGFALARHTAQGQTLIHGLVGTAIAALMDGQVEQFIQQPDAPNLYWPLAVLPQPLIDFRPSYECEMNFLVLNYPEFQDLENKHLDKEQWNALFARFMREFQVLIAPPGSAGPANPAAIALKLLQGYPRAQAYLIEHGRKKAEVEAMPQSQAILLYSLSLYKELSQEEFKALFLPYRESKAELEHMDAKLKAGFQQEVIPLASSLLPAVSSVKEAEVRTAWVLARLRLLEALRLYAAGHGGQLPERLSDVREVPVPVNPYDDKPFTYHRDGERATLDCERGPRNRPWRYEITMVKGE